MRPRPGRRGLADKHRRRMNARTTRHPHSTQAAFAASRFVRRMVAIRTAVASRVQTFACTAFTASGVRVPPPLCRDRRRRRPESRHARGGAGARARRRVPRRPRRGIAGALGQRRLRDDGLRAAPRRRSRACVPRVPPRAATGRARAGARSVATGEPARLPRRAHLLPRRAAVAARPSRRRSSTAARARITNIAPRCRRRRNRRTRRCTSWVSTTCRKSSRASCAARPTKPVKPR